MRFGVIKRQLVGGTAAILGMAGTTHAAPLQAPTAQETPAVTPALQPNASVDPQTPPPGKQIAPATADGDILVVANRYEATDLSMRSQNTVNVLSAEDLAHTAVHNVAEALGLLPGINVLSTGSTFIGGVDGAARGEGRFVSIRGLNSEYNVNLINGVEVAQGNPYSRGVQLSLLPPSGLQTIVLNKTSRADMNGDAVGGTVDFRTPTAFDSRGRYAASVTVGGRLESRARDYDRSGLGGNVAGDLSTKFGPDDQFGVYVSGFYDKRTFANSLIGGVMASGCCDFGYDFAVQGPGTPETRQNSAAGYDPIDNLILTGVNYGVSSGFTRRFGGNGSFDWRPDADTSLYVRGTYARSRTRQDTHLSQVIGMNKQQGSDGQPIGSTGLYQPIIGGVSTRFWYETNPELATLGTVQLGGEHRAGRLTIAPSLFYSWGRNDRPNHIEVAARTLGPDGNGIPYGGTTLFTFKDSYPVPLLTAEMRAAVGDVANMPAAGGRPQLTEQLSGQKKGGGKIDLQYDLDESGVQFIKAGARFQDSKRKVRNRDWTVLTYGGATTFGDLGIIKGSYQPVARGLADWAIPEIDQKALFALFERLGGATDATIDTCGPTVVDAFNCNTQIATEMVVSGYAMAQLQFGDLQVIPGVRYEHTEIRNTFWRTRDVDPATGATRSFFDNNKATFDVALPSLFLNYRPDSDAVYRAAAWTSYVRPPFLQLGGGASTTVSNGVITVREGNPDLKPIRAVNIDASGEWDFPTGTHVMVAGFYKRLRDYIFDAGSSAGVVSPTTGVGTITFRPVNGGAADVYGIEISARQKFSDMPAPLDGLGIAGNFTRQWTKVDLLGDGSRMERIQNAPNILANAQIFYEKGPIGFDLNYNYAGEYILVYDQFGRGSSDYNQWVRPIRRLDFHVGYSIGNALKIDFSISNLLKANSYWAHVGKNNLTISDIVNPGSTSLLTLTYKL